MIPASISVWRLPSLSLGALAGVLLIAPLPFGFRLAELTFLAVAGICLLLVSRQLGTTKLQIPAILFSVALTGTCVAAARGDPVVPFQFFRATVFPCLLLWLLYERISPWFLDNLERLLPLLVLGCCASALLYFGFKSDYYNSTLDIPYEDALYKRFFVYPGSLILVLLFDAIRCNRSSQFIYAGLLAVSGSKMLMASIVIVYVYFGLRRASLNRLVVMAISALALLVIAYLGGLFDRFADLLRFGDPWRIQEPLAAARRLMDPVRFLIGNGGGVPYWQGHVGLEAIQGGESRAVINTRFDVHNGFMTLALRFGVPLAMAYVAFFVRSIPRVDGGWILATVLLCGLLLSHGSVQMVDAVGLALGIRLLRHRLSQERYGAPGRT